MFMTNPVFTPIMGLFGRRHWSGMKKVLNEACMWSSDPLSTLSYQPNHATSPLYKAGNNKVVSITVHLTSCLTGLTSGIFCVYLQNRQIQTGQTRGQPYSDTSPFGIPCARNHIVV
jgi:hypothetical protein